MSQWRFEEYSDQFDTSKFDCGELILNEYLNKYMKQDLKRNASVSVLAVGSNDEVVGFYTLSSGSVQFENFPETLKKKIAPYPVPIARMGRLAVDRSMQRQGLGRELLLHAFSRVEALATKIGIRAIVVDAKNESAEFFYLKYGFAYLQNSAGSKKSFFMII
ncbi:MAG: hypothetical protein A2381_12240 [Bdellovibrionales bacterium RIFOXYB1_FULL_37_110]|nr:MAG: hypothetical protein A2181_01960 [Bdellovibrionales bacterium RIFOXYA1_FULL_38_20]OFZ52265.1 MAG: hypothetical protein A2417_06080 [Bdellovibrionales bacterium RIFOXYC1_FULL_37_79]OFZ57252.1 MAG: hypothetical protein A2381_12240 [Bdellovibrionales bacterium RIFOXYB1_FULL_37_110]OFZ65254.1 MAG: hypothetical protein A2577_04675 [Bdellovibrionales bacterium RIFOXYD1_FULL_36_51]